MLHLPPSSLFFRNFFLQCSTLHSYTRHIPPPPPPPGPFAARRCRLQTKREGRGGSPRSSLKGDENSRIGGRTFAPSAAKIKGASCEEEGGDAAQVCGVSYMGELALKHCFYRGKCEKVLQFHVSVSFSDFRKPTFLGPRALACGCNCRFSRRLHPFHDGSYHPIPRLPLLRSDRRNPCNFTSLQLRLRRLRRSEPSSPPPFSSRTKNRRLKVAGWESRGDGRTTEVQGERRRMRDAVFPPSRFAQLLHTSG